MESAVVDAEVVEVRRLHAADQVQVAAVGHALETRRQVLRADAPAVGPAVRAHHRVTFGVVKLEGGNRGMHRQVVGRAAIRRHLDVAARGEDAQHVLRVLVDRVARRVGHRRFVG